MRSRARSRLLLLLRGFHASALATPRRHDGGNFTSARCTSLDSARPAATFVARLTQRTETPFADPRTGNGEAPRFPRARTGACPPYIHTYHCLTSRPARKIRARVPLDCTHAPCQQCSRSFLFTLCTHMRKTYTLTLSLLSHPSLFVTAATTTDHERTAPISLSSLDVVLRTTPPDVQLTRTHESSSRFFLRGAVRARISQRTHERYPVDSSSPPIKRSRTTGHGQRTCTCLSRSTGRG